VVAHRLSAIRHADKMGSVTLKDGVYAELVALQVFKYSKSDPQMCLKVWKI
jgi:hypothetical protein